MVWTPPARHLRLGMRAPANSIGNTAVSLGCRLCETFGCSARPGLCPWSQSASGEVLFDFSMRCYPNRRQTWHQRDSGSCTSSAGHAKDESRLSRETGKSSRSASCSVGCLGNQRFVVVAEPDGFSLGGGGNGTRAVI